MRIGHGFDVHRLVAGRELILGGVKIPFEKGLLGHSDADVLTHAVIDAVLGAASAGDIGKHFPDTSAEFKGMSSMVLLKTVCETVAGKGFSLNNVDSTVVAQAPRISDLTLEMAHNIAGVAGLPDESVNVKATTSEGLGFTGRGEGIAAFAVVTLLKNV